MINWINKEFSEINFIGYASGLGGGDSEAKYGPEAFFSYLKDVLFPCTISKIIKEAEFIATDRKIETIAELLRALNKAVTLSMQNGRFFTVVGGDHSSGIGTWSTIACQLQETISLIWIDGHLDAHTFKSSPSQNVHGMSVANLLGFCDNPLLKLFDDSPAIRPEHLYLIGARSYEKEEVSFLKELGVRVYFSEEVLRRGIDSVLNEVITLIREKNKKFGMSIDIDAFDCAQMPGTGLHMENGLCVDAFINAIDGVNLDGLIGLEIAEYSPKKDNEFITAKTLIKMIDKIYRNYKTNTAHFKENFNGSACY